MGRSFFDYITHTIAGWQSKDEDNTSGFSNFIESVDLGVEKILDIKIHKDTIIRNKFFSGYTRKLPITWFVIHGTGGSGTLRWMRNTKPTSKRGKRYQKGIGLFHYLIERDGTIWNLIDPDKWVWHASIGRFDGGTIGVELVNPSPSNKKDYTAEQYDSLLALYNHLRTNKFPEMKTMISHNRAKIKINEGRLGGKQCPGKGFDWIMWKSMVKEYYNFAHNNGESLWHIEPL